MIKTAIHDIHVTYGTESGGIDRQVEQPNDFRHRTASRKPGSGKWSAHGAWTRCILSSSAADTVGQNLGNNDQPLREPKERQLAQSLLNVEVVFPPVPIKPPPRPENLNLAVSGTALGRSSTIKSVA
ncbi:hypothetical protein E4U42_005480 [Claviceps africana]|uniref:Uncharacterized protein n=1 Tax=Claviceps africana TaxID=83212 RepID=A0A8K0JBR5_9HYPO|nr:hypothetical protein E4U42_005480 [Claviceps africana]